MNTSKQQVKKYLRIAKEVLGIENGYLNTSENNLKNIIEVAKMIQIEEKNEAKEYLTSQKE